MDKTVGFSQYRVERPIDGTPVGSRSRLMIAYVSDRACIALLSGNNLTELRRKPTVSIAGNLHLQYPGFLLFAREDCQYGLSLSEAT
jgi:hypothetical protein